MENKSKTTIIAAVVTLVIVAGVGFWFWSKSKQAPSSQEAPSLGSKIFIISSIAIAVLLITGASVFAAYDTDKEKLKLIKYPVAELGSCKNFNECKTYCNKD